MPENEASASLLENKKVIVIGVVVGCVVFVLSAIAGVQVQSRMTEPVPASLTITRDTRMMNDGGFAVGKLNGQEYLVEGDWVTGDTVTAYPVTVEGGEKPRYTVKNSHPSAFAFGVLGSLFGAFGVTMLVVGFVIGEALLDSRRAQRRRESDEVMAAVMR